MSKDLPVATASTLLGRILGAAQALVSKALGVGLQGYGASGGGLPANPLYPVDRSMSALQDNPWVYASIQAICTDLAMLPLVVEVGEGDSLEQIAQHPLLTLFRYPHPKVSGRRLRRQWYADYALAGDSYVRVWRDPAETPIQLGRCPPQMVQPIVGDDGEELGWLLNGRARLPWNAILHTANVNWPATEALVFGQSPIQPLALGLQVDKDSRKHAGRAAKRGKLEMLLSPKDTLQYLSPEQSRGMVRQYGSMLASGDGVYVPPVAMEATALTLTPRDGEFLGMRDRTRAEVLAVFGVPETRVGSPAANYGTSKQQARIYWETLQGIAALFDDEFSRLAPPGVRIRHSFAKVEALQTSQTERQARAAIWVTVFGMKPKDAARYEGFIDAPIPEDQDAPEDADTSQDEEEVDEPREEGAVGAILACLAMGAQQFEGTEDPEGAERALSMALKLALMRHGISRERATLVADEAAGVCSAVAYGAHDSNLIELGAFGKQHAERILAVAQVA